MEYLNMVSPEDVVVVEVVYQELNYIEAVDQEAVDQKMQQALRYSFIINLDLWECRQ